MPSTPTITSFIDDSGAAQTQVSKGGATLDTSPVAKVLFGSDVQAGWAVQVNDRLPTGLLITTSHTITTSDIAQGFALVSASSPGGENDYTARIVDAAGAAGSASGDYSFIIGNTKTTPLADGSTLQSYNPNGYLDAQKYDPSGNRVGSLLQLPDDEAWNNIVPTSSGGYIAVVANGGRGGFGATVYDVDASGSVTGSGSIGEQTVSQIKFASDGGFVVVGRFDGGDQNGPLTNFSPTLNFFDASGHSTSTGSFEGAISLPGPIQSITADDQGHLLISWTEFSASGTLTVDPVHPNLSTPATPTLTLFDDSGSTVANGGTSGDTTPTFHISAQQVGEAFVSFIGPTGRSDQAISITSADVARGYVEVTEQANQGAGNYSAQVRVADATGSTSAASADSFTLQSSAGGGDTSSSGSTSGQTLTAHQAPDTLTGGAGNDTITASQGHDLLTGGGGSDVFVFNQTPWNAGDITDFVVGTDKLDLSALLRASGYTGSDPAADGYISLVSDGAGGTEVLYDTDGRASGDTIQYRITDLDHVSPSSLTWAQLSGSASTGGTGGTGGGDTSSGGSPPGQALTAHQAPDTLTGGAGNDTITASQGHDLLTGNGGADVFVFNQTPWNAGDITDFTVGSDKLDVSALLRASGYAGSDPVADGYISLVSDGAGGTEVLYDTDGHASGNTIQFRITDLDHVSPNGLTWAQLSGSASTGGTGGTGSGATAGQVLTADTAPDTLSGGAGADTITASQGHDLLTGGGGADVFVFSQTPWNAGDITDFAPGTDKIDLSALLRAGGYAGSDPFADGYVILVSDGAGGTEVLYDTDGRASGNTIQFRITDLDHVAPTQVSSSDFLLH